MVHGNDGSVPRTLVPCLGPLQTPAEPSYAPGRRAGGLARDGRRVSGGLSELRVIGPVCPVRITAAPESTGHLWRPFMSSWT